MNELEQRVKTLEKKVADLATEVQSQQKTINETTIKLDGKLIRSASKTV